MRQNGLEETTSPQTERKREKEKRRYIHRTSNHITKVISIVKN